MNKDICLCHMNSYELRCSNGFACKAMPANLFLQQMEVSFFTLGQFAFKCMNNFKCNHFYTACFIVECKMELLVVSCWVDIFSIKGFIIFYFKNVACRLRFISLEHSLINLQLMNLIQYLTYKVEKENVNVPCRNLGILPVHSGILKLKIFLNNFF